MKVGPYWDDWVHPKGALPTEQQEEQSSTYNQEDDEYDKEDDEDENAINHIPVDWETQIVYITEDGEQDSEPEEGAYVEVERVLWALYRVEGSSYRFRYDYTPFWE